MKWNGSSGDTYLLRSGCLWAGARAQLREKGMQGSGWFVQTKETAGAKRYARYVAYMSHPSMVDILNYFFVRCLSRDSNFLCDVKCKWALRNRGMIPVSSIALNWRRTKLPRDHSKIMLQLTKEICSPTIKWPNYNKDLVEH